MSGCHDGFNGNGGGLCCTSSNQCGEGEGDCDHDSDCFGDLKCGQGNGRDDNCDSSLGFPSTHDCCYDPKKRKKIHLRNIISKVQKKVIKTEYFAKQCCQVVFKCTVNVFRVTLPLHSQVWQSRAMNVRLKPQV